MTFALGIQEDFYVVDGLERVTLTVAGTAYDNRHTMRSAVESEEVQASGGTARLDDVHFEVPHSELRTPYGVSPDIGTQVSDDMGTSYVALMATVDRVLESTDLLCRKTSIVLDPSTDTTTSAVIDAASLTQGPAGNPIRTWVPRTSEFDCAIIELSAETVEEQGRQGLRVSHQVLIAQDELDEATLAGDPIEIKAGDRLRRADAAAVYVIRNWTGRQQTNAFWTIFVDQVL